MRLLRPTALLSIATVAVVSTSSAAQPRFEIGLLAGFFEPFGSYTVPAYYTTRLPVRPSDLSAFAWGGQLQGWVTRRFGLQVQGTYASSDVGGVVTPVGETPVRSAHIVNANAQVMFAPIASPNGRLWLSVGPGIVQYGGATYEAYGSPTQMAVVAGVGSAIPLSHQLAATVGITTTIYSLDIRDNTGVTVTRGTQVDALFHFGVAWAIH